MGGFLMSWVDEYWKGAKPPAVCDPTIDDPDFSPKTCKYKAHVTCGNWDTSVHDICGEQPPACLVVCARVEAAHQYLARFAPLPRLATRWSATA